MDLQNRKAVITGASRGIGRAVSIRLAEAGAEVCGLARSEDALKETAELVAAQGGKMKAFKCDITDTEAVAAVIDQIAREEERIDILVNNAGATRDNLLARMSPEDWDLVIRTNLKGTFNTCKAILRPMLRQKYGRIINISSVNGIMGAAGQTNYAASKAGIIGFTKSLAKEVASRKITVNAVAPGFVLTAMTGDLSDKIKEEAMSAIPLRRFGEPEDIAEAVAFLASDAASYITGHVLQVDGGIAM